VGRCGPYPEGAPMSDPLRDALEVLAFIAVVLLIWVAVPA
jgi:hypothetical protein